MDYQKLAQQASGWRSLPSTILRRIFAKLSPMDLVNVGRLCPEFAQVARDSELWRKVNLQFVQCFEPGALGELLLMPIRELNLSAARIPEIIFSPGSRGADPKFYAQIQILNVTRTYPLQQNDAQTLLRKCRPEELIFDHNTITIPALNAMGKNNRLEVLSMENCTFSSDHFGPPHKRIANLPSDLEFPSTLEKLMMNHTNVHDWFWTDQTRIKQFYSRILAKNTKLKYLGLPMPILRHASHYVAKLPLLEVLVFCICEWNNSVRPDFHRIVRKLPRLKAVHIQNKQRDTAGNNNDSINLLFTGSKVQRFMDDMALHRIKMVFEVTNTECKILLEKEK